MPVAPNPTQIDPAATNMAFLKPLLHYVPLFFHLSVAYQPGATPNATENEKCNRIFRAILDFIVAYCRLL